MRKVVFCVHTGSGQGSCVQAGEYAPVAQGFGARMRKIAPFARSGSDQGSCMHSGAYSPVARGLGPKGLQKAAVSKQVVWEKGASQLQVGIEAISRKPG
eukprot:5592397-Lingulodinium_polyedra.AAC.1